MWDMKDLAEPGTVITIIGMPLLISPYKLLKIKEQRGKPGVLLKHQGTALFTMFDLFLLLYSPGVVYASTFTIFFKLNLVKH